MNMNKMTIPPEQFELILQLTCEWAEKQESLIIRSGLPLTDSQIKDAGRVGIANPDRIHLLRVTQIPYPTHPTLADMAKHFLPVSPAGLTLRYGIFIRDDCWTKRSLIIHEFVHTLQYERFGGFLGFLRAYITELLYYDYPFGPLEQEAILFAKSFSK